jgi:hypothetical protein
MTLLIIGAAAGIYIGWQARTKIKPRKKKSVEPVEP